MRSHPKKKFHTYITSGRRKFQLHMKVLRREQSNEVNSEDVPSADRRRTPQWHHHSPHCLREAASCCSPRRNRYHLSFNRQQITHSPTAPKTNTLQTNNCRTTKKRAWSPDEMKNTCWQSYFFFLSLSVSLFDVFFSLHRADWPVFKRGALQRYRLAGTCLGEHNKQHMPLK